MTAPTARFVLVVGGANLDVLARSHAALQPGTSNPGTAVRTPGGVGRNVAENLARLGTPTRLLLAVGRDAAGDELLARTRAAGVDTIVVPWAGPTGTYTALLDHDGSLVAGVADMAATESLHPAHLDPQLIAGAGWIVLDGNLTPAMLEHALRLADEAAVPVVLDPVSAPKAALIRPLLTGARVHTVTPTLEELRALTGHDDVEAAVDSLHRDGAEVVWLREGDRGSRLFRHGCETATVRLPAVTPVDVTGAGDAMLAGYLHALCSGAALVRAAWEGAAAAMLTVQSDETVRDDLTHALLRAVLDQHPPPSPEASA